jgi:hypothetical protein
MYAISPDHFTEIRIARNMLVDHLPSAYDTALEALHLSVMRSHEDFRSARGSSGSLGGDARNDIELGKGDDDIQLANLGTEREGGVDTFDDDGAEGEDLGDRKP